MAEVVGRGRLVAGGDGAAEGRFTAILDTQDLLRAMDDESGDGLVVYIVSPIVTMIAPIHDHLVAIVCEGGDEFAHVAIVARELGVPCAVQATLERPPRDLEGAAVSVEPTGEVRLAGGAP